MAQNLRWQYCRFDQLQVLQLYQILQLRTEVFVLEQNCPYQDMDGNDQQAYHLTARRDDTLLCYARLLPPGLKYATPSIGRVITRAPIRGEGFGIILVEKAIAACHETWPGQAVTISAQQHLEKFYGVLGFSSQSEPYMEDGIPHIEMLLKRASS